MIGGNLLVSAPTEKERILISKRESRRLKIRKLRKLIWRMIKWIKE
tara:strand:- start:770 stop:907 length:138 start_codon:yes stop_codon:yes gene_type:complete